MQTISWFLWITFSIAVPAIAVDGAPGVLWGELPAGPYAVGFRTRYERDVSRPWPDSDGRPIRIAIWYPTRPGVHTETMRHVDYLHYDWPEMFHDLNDALESSDRRSWISDLTEVAPNGGEIAARLFATTTAAHRDAAPAPGPFPLLLYSAGLGARGDSNVELGEFLASHGYVVATVPNIGASPAELEMTNSAADLETHTRDLEFAWNVLRHFAWVDSTKVATAGHSAGGIVALYLAMRHPDVKAVVSLDGSYGFTTHVKFMLQLTGYKPAPVAAALLDLRRANHVQGATHDQTVVRAMRHADRYLVSLPRMFHGDFTEFGAIGRVLSVPLPSNDDARTRQSGFEGNQHAYRAALAFLDAKLRRDRTGMRRVTAEFAAVPGATIAHLRH